MYLWIPNVWMDIIGMYITLGTLPFYAHTLGTVHMMRDVRSPLHNTNGQTTFQQLISPDNQIEL